MKLGKRLQHLESMVTSHYDHIWDCCCDHGLLGAALIARQAAPVVHFVDLVADLMRELENKLTRFFPNNSTSTSQWQVHCMDVSTLPLREFHGKHLIIIAGVGGDLMSELVKAIHQQNPSSDIDFLLCPVHHQYTLRQQLIALDLSLKAETLVTENARYYEIMHVSTAKNPHAPISLAGSLMWNTNSVEQSKIAADYLHKTLDHYRRMQLNRLSNVQHIIDAYSAVKLH